MKTNSFPRSLKKKKKLVHIGSTCVLPKPSVQTSRFHSSLRVISESRPVSFEEAHI